jgi:hypothetical protein
MISRHPQRAARKNGRIKVAVGVWIEALKLQSICTNGRYQHIIRTPFFHNSLIMESCLAYDLAALGMIGLGEKRRETYES